MKLNEVLQEPSTPLTESIKAVNESVWSAPMTGDQLLAALDIETEDEDGQES